jgi:hypothetical protein
MHKTILIAFVVFGFFAFTGDIFGQQIYKSVDEKGTINFTDNPTSPVLETKKGPPRENGIEVLKKSEMGNRSSVIIVGGKTIVLDYSTKSGSGPSSSGGSSRTVRTGRA